MPSFKSSFSLIKAQKPVHMRLAINQQYSVIAGTECKQNCMPGSYGLPEMKILNMSAEPVSLS
jgi:hypothetical protein